MIKTALGRFRIVAILEGISYIVLLGIAMPLKYAMDMPQAVSIVGRAHGALFVLYCFVLLNVWLTQRWPITKTLIAFVASMIPFGAFVFDWQIKDEQPVELDNVIRPG